MSISRRATLQLLPALAGFALLAPAHATPAGGIKVLELLIRKDGSSHDAFMQHWRDMHGPMAAKVAGLLGYVAQEVVSHPPARTDIHNLPFEGEVDGIAELWFADAASMASALQSAPGRSWLADKAEFVGHMKGFVGRQDVIVPIARPTPALKSNAFLGRKPDQSTAEFRQEWHAVHGAMAVKVPYLGGFILFDVEQVAPPQGIAEIAMGQVDGVAETYFASHEDQLRMIATPEAKEWFKDGAGTFGEIKSFNTMATNFVAPPIG